MHITVVGAGYVGLVTAACFAEVGNTVTVLEVNADKIAQLQKGVVPFYEPDLPELVQQGLAQGSLIFTQDTQKALQQGEVIFLAVGTPEHADGTADLTALWAVARAIIEHVKDPRVIVIKSTVPVGTHMKMRALFQEAGVAHSVVSNPEFLKEGAAVNDFRRPDRIVLGTTATQAKVVLQALYGPFNRNHNKVLVMQPASAELTKYAANFLLANKVAAMNEMANIAEHYGADIDEVRQGVGSDPRIGRDFIYAGCGFGGSCFPKDLQALAALGRAVGYTPQIVEAVLAQNEHQKQRLYEKISAHFKGSLQGRTFAIWGLSFKPNTDDLRHAPSLVLMQQLLNAGARLQVFDPVVSPAQLQAYLPAQSAVQFSVCPYTALESVDALIVVTEWRAFLSPDFDKMGEAMKQKLIFDGRNIYALAYVASKGFSYYGIGRSQTEEVSHVATC